MLRLLLPRRHPRVRAHAQPRRCLALRAAGGRRRIMLQLLLPRGRAGEPWRRQRIARGTDLLPRVLRAGSGAASRGGRTSHVRCPRAAPPRRAGPPLRPPLLPTRVRPPRRLCGGVGHTGKGLLLVLLHGQAPVGLLLLLLVLLVKTRRTPALRLGLLLLALALLLLLLQEEQQERRGVRARWAGCPWGGSLATRRVGTPRADVDARDAAAAAPACRRCCTAPWRWQHRGGYWLWGRGGRGAAAPGRHGLGRRRGALLLALDLAALRRGHRRGAGRTVNCAGRPQLLSPLVVIVVEFVVELVR